MNYTIRVATKHDVHDIVELCKEHAAYEKAEYNEVGKAEKLANLLSPMIRPLFNCLLVESENKVIGFASYMYELSTWDADYYVHMDCLYLRPHARGFGIGEALMKEIAKAAAGSNIKVIQWQTPIFNERAIKFYYRIGAVPKEKLRLYLDEAAINKLTK